MSKLLLFRKRRSGMARKKANARIDDIVNHASEIPKLIEASRSRRKKIEKKTIGLPADVWRTLTEDADYKRRTIAKQIEVILVIHYKLAPLKDDDLDSSKG